MRSRRKTMAMIVLLLLSAAAQAQLRQLLPVVVGGKYGLIDTKGEIVLQPSYDLISDFGKNNFSVVKQGRYYGAIDLNGKQIMACTQDSIVFLSDSVFASKKGNSWALTDYHGVTLTAYRYDGFRKASYKCFIFISAGLLGLIDRKGVEVIPAGFDDLRLSDSLVYTYRNGYVGLYTLFGKKLLDTVNDQIFRKNRNIAFYEKNGKMGYVSLVSGRVIEAEWDEMSLLDPYETGWYANRKYQVVVGRNEKLGLYLSVDDALILGPEYDLIQVLMPGFIEFKKHGRSGLLTVSGKILLMPAWDDIVFLGENYFRIIRNGRSGIADTSGKILVSPKYNSITYLQRDEAGSGLFCYTAGGRSGLLRSDSAELTQADFKSVEAVNSGFLVVQQNGKYGLLGLNGKMIREPEYDDIGERVDNVHTVFDGKKVGLVNSKGMLLAKPVYDKITVVDKTFKAYQGDNLEIIWLNDEGGIAERVSYQGIPSVHVIDNAARILQWSTAAGTTSVPKTFFKFYYSAANMKWGVKDLYSGRVAIEPQFDKVDATDNSRFAIVFVNTDTIWYEIDNCRFYSLQACGMVDMRSGNLVLKPEYLDISICLSKYAYWFARLINTAGQFGYASSYGVYIDNYSFISQFRSRLSRVNVGGSLIVTNEENQNTVADLGAFISSFKCRLRYCDGYTRSMVLSDKTKLACEGGYWGQLYINLNRADFERFDWISKDYSGSYIVRMNNQSVLLRDNNFIRIGGINYYKFLTTLNQQPYFVISKDYTKYGFVKTDGSFLTDIEFDYACDFSEGYAAVKLGQRWGYIDRSGTLAIRPLYDAAAAFSEGLAAVKMGTKWGYIDTKGDTVINAQYNKAGNFAEGYASVRRSGRSFYINTSGVNEFGKSFSRCQAFSNGYAIASDRNGTGVINTEGVWVVMPKYDRVSCVNASENIVIVAKSNKYGIVNLQGEKLRPVKYTTIRPPSEGIMAVRLRSHWGFVNNKGRNVIPFMYDEVHDFSEGRATVRSANHWGAIDNANKTVIPFKYQNIGSYHQGICLAGESRDMNVMIDPDGNVNTRSSIIKLIKNFSGDKAIVLNSYHRICYADKSGRFLFGLEFSAARPFVDSLAAVKVDEEWGIINDKGAWVLPAVYDSVRDFKEGAAVVLVAKHEGLADSRGIICVQPEFQSVETAPYGLIRVRQNGAMGYVDISGREIWKPTK